MYAFILLNDYDANKKNGNIRDYILKCLVKREAISKKVKKNYQIIHIKDDRDDLKKIRNGSYFH